MKDDDRQIEDLARAVIDGASVDWTAAESHDDGTRRLVKHLKVVAAVARAHREEHSTEAADSPVRPGPPPLQSWGHLRVIEHIARGAFGDVYRAWDPRLERQVALKLVPAGPEDGAASAMLREGRLLARVRHPNVVTIHGADHIGEHVGLWMELVNGRTLHEMLEDGHRFEPAEVTRIGLELARAVEAVHAAGLFHRDIKAQNVMLADDGRIVLMDFGAGRDLTDTRSGATGTPLYLAPEIFRGQPATTHTDVYSLGVLLFHLLTRSFPFQATTVHDLRLAHEQNGPARLRTVRPDVPSGLARVIDRATDPRPKQRHATAGAIVAELEATAASVHRRWFALAAAAVLLTALGWWLIPAPPAIAILPFENHVSESGDDVIPEGFVIELSRRLAQVEGLRVRSALSSLGYKGRSRDVKTFGRELGANLLLEGSVFGEAGTIRRINASLVRVADEETIWAGSFAPDNDDVFGVQEQIALAIADALRLRFAPGQRTYKTNPGLQYLFYRAQALRARRDTDSRTRAVVLFEEINEADPGFMPAAAGLARALLTISGDRDGEQPLDPRAEPLATTAVADDPGWAEAQAAMGLLCAHRHDWDCARSSFERAIQLDPGMTTTHADFVLSTLLPLGRVEEALRLLENALLEEPTSLDVKRALAHMQVENGLYDDAIRTSKEIMAVDPDLRFVEQWLGRALYLTGRYDEALAVFKQRRWPYRGYVLAVTGRQDEARALLAQYPKPVARHMIVYAGLGDLEGAFDALEDMAARDPWRALTWMQRIEMNPLRSDPRFDDIRKRLLQPRALAAGGAGAIANPSAAPSAPPAAGQR